MTTRERRNRRWESDASRSRSDSRFSSKAALCRIEQRTRLFRVSDVNISVAEPTGCDIQRVGAGRFGRIGGLHRVENIVLAIALDRRTVVYGANDHKASDEALRSRTRDLPDSSGLISVDPQTANIRGEPRRGTGLLLGDVEFEFASRVVTRRTAFGIDGEVRVRQDISVGPAADDTVKRTRSERDGSKTNRTSDD